MIPWREGATFRTCFKVTHRKHWWNRLEYVGDIYWTRAEANATKPAGRGFGVAMLIKDVSDD